MEEWESREEQELHKKKCPQHRKRPVWCGHLPSQHLKGRDEEWRVFLGVQEVLAGGESKEGSGRGQGILLEREYILN